MILPSVSETLASVSRHPALESAISALLQSSAHERLAGLTDTAKALIAGQVATEVRRPVVVLVASGAQAGVAGPHRFNSFTARSPDSRPPKSPSFRLWTYCRGRTPLRTPKFWRLAQLLCGDTRQGSSSGRCADCRRAHAARRRCIYAEQARTLAREESVSLDDLVSHLRRVGYELHDMVECRDNSRCAEELSTCFRRSRTAPVRLEFFGDSLESLA